ncbi:3-hydroxymyristoyl/3-hydroxydecanoyl-(acyl carrier protein) dehydratase [Algoriella xinjiangensis]|uniref:3-hydroxymyristoyl/3-hydroxydecanoyl-(Acyl carrier protein) dehydratase n=1 Tax=Algoriella xinjiangensis TaxID=684065 RepID=A0A1I4X8B2_9FLAO|nr:hypothetical protein [Algoriella xinjiangensis]SFN21676.1 3-hydroxymyristoyl/3-hydroxydecanoyl-(acyl carrier protein) dehydratase [Algoriella xinjiangensis]VDH14771.1 (3R)-hydroxymyristoyl-ACP dehydratase [Algoriella xinjiangensis]
MIKSNQNIAIQQFLPHRQPMLFVDTIILIETNYVEAIYTIKSDQLFLQNDYFSEIGLIENMAQVCSSIIGQKYFIDDDLQKGDLIGYISTIKTCTIYNLPKINQTILTKAKLLEVFDYEDYAISTMETQVFIDDKVYATATLNLLLQNHKR